MSEESFASIVKLQKILDLRRKNQRENKLIYREKNVSGGLLKDLTKPG
jgi:hypothetical protein